MDNLEITEATVVYEDDRKVTVNIWFLDEYENGYNASVDFDKLDLKLRG